MIKEKEERHLTSEDRCFINGEAAIKPYYYFRNGLLHVRHTVDRAMDLSREESLRLKEELTQDPANKQIILQKAWNFYADFVKKDIIKDGLKAGDVRIKELTDEYTCKKHNI